MIAAQDTRSESLTYCETYYSLGARILTGPFYLQLLIFFKYVCLLCITVWAAPDFNVHLPFTRLIALYSFFYFLELLF